MADCEYQIAGDDRIYSESEFKKLLSEGYLDKVMLEKQIKVRGIKPNEELAKTFKLPSAIQPAAEVKTEVTPTAEVKTEEVVTPTETVTEEKSFDDKVVEEYVKITNPYSLEEDSERIISYSKNRIESTQKYINGDISAKDYLINGLLYSDNTLINDKRLSELSNEELKRIADENAKDINESINQAKQKVQAKPVTKTEEKVTEPAAKVKEVVSDDRVAEEYAKSTNSDIEAAKKSISDVEKYNNGEMSPKEYLESKGYSEKNFFEVGADREIKDFSDLTEEEFKEVADRTASYANNRINEIKQKVQAEPVTEPTAEVTPETKQPTREAVAAKNMADILRKAKIKMEGGTAMASFLPGFEDVWNGSIEAVSKAIELGGITAGNFRQSIEAGMKALKQTDAYKAITDPKERAKISARYKKILTSAYSEGYDIDTDKLREAEFNDFNQKLEENKGKTLSAKEFNALKSEAKKFVNDNLPADSYRKSEVQSYVRNNFDKAKTVEDIQKNLDKVNSIMTTKEAKIEEAEAKQVEKDRKAAIKRIKEKVNIKGRFMSAKVGKTKKSRVSIDAQEKIDEMRNQGLFEDDYLNSLNKEDTDALEARVDKILGIGKEERAEELQERKEERKAKEAIILKALDDPDLNLDNEQDIMDMFEANPGSVVIIKDENGNEITMNKSDFEDYIEENPDADLSDVPFYFSRSYEMSEMMKKFKPGFFNIRSKAFDAIRNLETYFADLSKGDKKMRAYLNENMNNITNGLLAKLENAYYKKKDVNKGIKDIFGGLKKGNKILDEVNSSGIEINEGGRNPIELSNGQLIDVYNLVRDKYEGKDIDADKVEKNRKRIKTQNRIDPDKVIQYIENNPKLKEFADFTAKKYNDEYRQEYAATFEFTHGYKMPDTYYYPEPASEVDPSDAMNLESTTKGMSAMVPNLRLRKDYTGPFLIIDARDKMNMYIDSMAHAKEFIPIVESIRPLFSTINRPRILEKLGNTDKYKDLKEILENVLSDRNVFLNQGPFGDIASFASIGALWSRPKSIFQQASALLNYYPAGYSEGITPFDIIASQVPLNNKEINFVKDFLYNPYLWERLSGSNVTIESQAIKNTVDKLLPHYIGSTINALNSVGLTGIKLGDFLAIASPTGGGGFALAHFKKAYQENGGDYEAAKKYALQQWFKATERTQQPSKDVTVVSTGSANPLFRVIVPFVSAQLAATRKAVVAIKNIQDWKNLDPKQKQQARADLIYYATVGNIPFLLGSGAILGAISSAMSYAQAEDEEDKEIALNELKLLEANLLLDRFQSDMQALSLLGVIGSYTLNNLRGKSWFNNNPTFQKLNQVGIALSSLIKATETDWNKLNKDEKRDFFKRHGFDKYEEKRFNRLTYEEKQKYIDEHPLMKQAMTADEYKEFIKMYSELPIYQRMGEEGTQAWLNTLNLKNPNKLFKAIDAVLDGVAEPREAIMDIATEDVETDYNEYYSPFVKNKEDWVTRKIFGKSAAEMLIKDIPVAPTKDQPQVGGPRGGAEGGPIGGPR